jgi:hypothetical protein
MTYALPCIQHIGVLVQPGQQQALHISTQRRTPSTTESQPLALNIVAHQWIKLKFKSLQHDIGATARSVVRHQLST